MNKQENGDLDNIEEQQGKLIEELSDTPILGTCPYIENVSVEGIQNNLGKIKKAFNDNFSM